MIAHQKVSNVLIFANLIGEKDNKARRDLIKLIEKIASIANIKEIQDS